MDTTNPNNTINPANLNPPPRWPCPQDPGAHAQSAFYGEAPAAATIQAMARQIRTASTRLMHLTPENWTAVQDSEQLDELAAATDELKVTVTAMSGEAAGNGRSTCLLAQVRDALRTYRRRLQFLAVNLRFTDPGARELLAEILAFDRWRSFHVSRCPECRPEVNAHGR